MTNLVLPLHLHPHLKVHHPNRQLTAREPVPNLHQGPQNEEDMIHQPLDVLNLPAEIEDHHPAEAILPVDPLAEEEERAVTDPPEEITKKDMGVEKTEVPQDGTLHAHKQILEVVTNAQFILEICHMTSVVMKFESYVKNMVKSIP